KLQLHFVSKQKLQLNYKLLELKFFHYNYITHYMSQNLRNYITITQIFANYNYFTITFFQSKLHEKLKFHCFKHKNLLGNIYPNLLLLPIPLCQDFCASTNEKHAYYE